MRLRTLIPAVAVALLALAGPASAAYAPRLAAKLDPATPASPSALTITVTQAPGESANRDEVVRFPPEFRFNPGFAVAGCTPAAEAESACPEASRIGTARAETELGSFSGPVYLTQDFRSVIFLRGFGGLVQQKVEGAIRLAADGWVETVLSGLPDVKSTVAEVRLEAGSRSLMLTPDACGTYPIEGRFTSHAGELAAPRTEVRIEGCEARPEIAGLTVRSRARRLDVAWHLAEAGARTDVALDRRVSTRPWTRWRRVRRAVARAAAGRNTLRLGGARGRALAPGRYRVTLTTYGPRGGPVDTRRAEATVR